MNITHHVAFPGDEPDRRALLAAGVELKIGVSNFRIDESDQRWPAIEALARQFKAIDIATTTFSPSELKTATYVALAATGHHGYPEPSDDFGYLAATYDLSDYCPVCGIGKRQVRPFRFAKAPVWGRNSVLKLNWIFEEHFVKPQVWSALFEPFGIGCRPVVLHKNGDILDSVVQLDVTAVAELQLDHCPSERCNSCGRIKYAAHRRGFFPAPASVPTGAAAVKSAQYFGSGASANRAVLVNKELYTKLAASGIRGLTFMACAQPRP